MNTQSIIVYRSPFEAWMWESLMSSGFVFPLFCGVLVFFAVLFACVQLGGKFYGSYGKKGSIVTNVSMTLAVIAAIATVNYMLI